jgi:hypothetical protein
MNAKFCAVIFTAENQEQVDLVNEALAGLQRQGVDIRLQTALMDEMVRRHGNGNDEVH